MTHFTTVNIVDIKLNGANLIISIRQLISVVPLDDALGVFDGQLFIVVKLLSIVEILVFVESVADELHQLVQTEKVLHSVYAVVRVVVLVVEGVQEHDLVRPVVLTLGVYQKNYLSCY